MCGPEEFSRKHFNIFLKRKYSSSLKMIVILKSILFSNEKSPGQCGSVGWSIIPQTRRLQVQLLVRAHAQLGHEQEGNQSIFLSYIVVSFSLLHPPSLSSSLSPKAMEKSPLVRLINK